LSNFAFALKNRGCCEFTVLNIYFLLFRIFQQLALALKIFTVLNILFTFRIEQLSLALKNRVVMEIFTVLKYFLSIRVFQQFALTLKIFKPWGAASPPPRTPMVKLNHDDLLYVLHINTFKLQ